MPAGAGPADVFRTVYDELKNLGTDGTFPRFLLQICSEGGLAQLSMVLVCAIALRVPRPCVSCKGG